jgi:aryl-alcohol dehydrogenase-like predicted oxidoreductase
MIKLGKTGPEVFPIGLGCMGMSPGTYGATDEKEGIATIHLAIERGVTLLDTGDFYGMGHNEMLISRAIEGRRDKVQLSVKFGAMRGPDGSWLGFDARPQAVKNFLAYSLKRLRVDVIDIYRPSRLDPSVPIEETIGTVADCVKAGWVRHIGISELGAESIRRAAKVHPIVDMQIEYAIATRGPEAKVFPALAEIGASATLYGVFSRGLLAGSKPTGPADARNHFPRFKDGNAALVAKLHAFAKERSMTPVQLLLGWVLAKQPTLLPVVGSRTRAQLTDALGALDKPLSAADVSALETLVPEGAITGARYPEPMMKTLDSER